MNKKYSKIVMTVVICLSLLCSYRNVSAKETATYFTNKNGVSLTKEEYDYLTKLYFDGYQKMMTQEQYQRFVDNDIISREIESKSVILTDGPLTRGPSHVTFAKRLDITKSCDESNCLITSKLKWLGTPVVKGYDVMGSYIEGIEIISTPTTGLSSPEDSFFTDEEDMQRFNNGFGTTFIVPDGADPVIFQDFFCKGSGHIYSSYQHAMSAISREDSRNFTMSGIGYGGVFEFKGKAKELYDEMNGVDIAV